MVPVVSRLKRYDAIEAGGGDPTGANYGACFMPFLLAPAGADVGDIVEPVYRCANLPVKHFA
jgi:hypothetical protein